MRQPADRALSLYRHVLFTTDLLEGCLNIGQRAVEIARFYNARISLLHVIEHVPVDLDDGIMPVPPSMLDEQLVREARTSLDRLAVELGIAEAERWVEVGSTKAQIIRVCQEQLVDLLVIGTHSRHGFSLLFGSTSRAVLGDAPCDVFAVRVKR